MTDNVVRKIKDVFEGILSDKKTLVKVLLIVLILLIAAVLRIYDANRSDVRIESADPAEKLEYSGESDENGENYAGTQILYVDIGGAVENPGVYQVTKDTRLYQVIEMAGGLTEDADADSVNRASFVEDGQKIIIPVKGSVNSESISLASPAVAADTASGLININTASADELKTLSGIGDAMAGRIIDYRSAHPFKSTEDIMSVEGIGSKTYDKIKDRITV